jgi:hypothetical protein
MKRRVGRRSDADLAFQTGGYRYYLYLKLADCGAGQATFIMLNPSTADQHDDDPTIRRCVGFCRRWGYGELHVVNVFALRATHPQDLTKAPDPVGPLNLDWIIKVVDWTADPRNCGPRGKVVCAWVAQGSYRDQDRIVWEAIQGLCAPLALALTRQRQPRHPLYVPYATRLDRYAGRRPSAPAGRGARH